MEYLFNLVLWSFILFSLWRHRTMYRTTPELTAASKDLELSMRDMDRDFRTFERIVNEQAKIIKSGNAVRALVLARTLIIRTPEIMQDPIYIRFACSPLAAFLLTYPLVGFDEWYTR